MTVRDDLFLPKSVQFFPDFSPLTHPLLTGSGEYPWEIIRKAHDLGLTLGGIPEKYGGLGLSLLTICMIGERLAYGCSGITTAMNANELGNYLSYSIY